MSWKTILFFLALLAVVASALTVFIDVQYAHFFSEPDLSTGELLSANWWHPVVRLAALYFWLLFVVSSLLASVMWLVGRVQARSAAG